MEDTPKQPNTITMISYTINNDKRQPSQNWEIIPKKKYSIGRSKKEVDISLNEKLLSRKHAELVYYDSKTIMVKDLESRNGTYINKEKIAPLRETFFSSKDILSFGSTNNEIVFFDKSEQGKEIVESDFDRNKENEKVKDIEEENEYNKNDNGKKENAEEEINNNLRKSYDKKISNDRSKDKNYEQKSMDKIVNEKERESYQRSKRYEEDYNNKYNERSSYGSQRMNSKQIDRERNIEKSLSNRETYKSRRDNYDKKEMKSYGRNDEYNYSDRDRRSKHYSNKSRSISRERKYRSRSRETLQRSRLDSKRDNSRIPPEREYRNYDYYDKKERNKEREDEYRINEMRIKEERERDRGREREEEEYLRRKEYERQKLLEEENEEELNYRMKMRAGNNKNENNEYDERIRDEYKLDIDKMNLKAGKLDVSFSKNKNDKNEKDEGFIKCYVSGYMYLNINNLELIKKLPNYK